LFGSLLFRLIFAYTESRALRPVLHRLIHRRRRDLAQRKRYRIIAVRSRGDRACRVRTVRVCGGRAGSCDEAHRARASTRDVAHRQHRSAPVVARGRRQIPQRTSHESTPSRTRSDGLDTLVFGNDPVRNTGESRAPTGTVRPRRLLLRTKTRWVLSGRTSIAMAQDWHPSGGSVYQSFPDCGNQFKWFGGNCPNLIRFRLLPRRISPGFVVMQPLL